MLRDVHGAESFSVDPNQGLYLTVGLGVIGGLFIGKYAYEHLFVEGLTAEERKGMLLFAAGTAAIWGIGKLMEIPEYRPYRQWVDPAHMFLPDDQEASTP